MIAIITTVIVINGYLVTVKFLAKGYASRIQRSTVFRKIVRLIMSSAAQKSQVWVLAGAFAYFANAILIVIMDARGWIGRRRFDGCCLFRDVVALCANSVFKIMRFEGSGGGIIDGNTGKSFVTYVAFIVLICNADYSVLVGGIGVKDVIDDRILYRMSIFVSADVLGVSRHHGSAAEQ